MAAAVGSTRSGVGIFAQSHVIEHTHIQTHTNCPHMQLEHYLPCPAQPGEASDSEEGGLMFRLTLILVEN